MVRDDVLAWAGDRLKLVLTKKLSVKQLAREYAVHANLEFETARQRIRDAVESVKINKERVGKSEVEECGFSELEAMRRQVALLEREKNKLAARLADEDRIVEQIKDHIAALKPSPKFIAPKYKTTTQEQEMVALFSDGQIGEKVDIEEMGGIGGAEGYNIEVFDRRLRYWAEKVVSIARSHRKITPIRKLNIFGLGDSLENEVIFPGQKGRITDPLTYQLIKGADLIAGAFSFMAGEFEEVEIDWLAGNHGRPGRKGENLHYDNWEYLLAGMVQSKLEKHSNIIWQVPKSWWMIREVLGWKFYLTHGDDIMRYMGLPYYSVDKYDAKMTLLLQEQGISFDYLCMGRHHQCVQWDRPWGEKLINGTFVSGNAFAAKKLQANCRPTQLVFGVHKDRGISWRYPIRLDEKNRGVSP
jgi:hypothetical protein